jgi:hypothetical protein
MRRGLTNGLSQRSLVMLVQYEMRRSRLLYSSSMSSYCWPWRWRLCSSVEYDAQTDGSLANACILLLSRCRGDHCPVRPPYTPQEVGWPCSATMRAVLAQSVALGR